MAMPPYPSEDLPPILPPVVPPPPIDSRFNTLPREAYQEILLNLDYKTIKNLCITKKDVEQTCRNPYFWYLKYNRDFNNTIPFIPSEQSFQFWRDKYKYSLALKTLKPGYDVIINKKHIFVKAKSEDEIWKFLAQVYNNDQLPSSDIRNELILFVNEQIKRQNSFITGNSFTQILGLFKKFRANTQLRCLIDTINDLEMYGVLDIIEYFYLTPELLFSYYKNGTMRACFIYEIVLFFEMLYKQKFLIKRFDHVPDFSKLKAYYSQYLPFRPGFHENIIHNIDVSGVKFLPKVTPEFLKNKIQTAGYQLSPILITIQLASIIVIE